MVEFLFITQSGTKNKVGIMSKSGKSGKGGKGGKIGVSNKKTPQSRSTKAGLQVI